MKEQVISNIKKYHLIKKGEHVVIGVSGGPDSMALLYILNDIKDDISFSLHVAHVNHQIRGKASDEDEEYVKGICQKYDLPFYIRRGDIPRFAQQHKITEEEAGREIRYGFFNEILNNLGRGKIAVAHNKNDQAETLLMRFFRGTGIDGLVGMTLISGNVIRPLLPVTRKEIEKYCREHDLHPRIDQTNLQPIYGRNKIRLELIPYIENNINRGIIDTLFRTSKIMKMDSDFFNSYIEKTYKMMVKDEGEKRISMELGALREVHSSILSRLIRYAINELNGDLKGIEEKHSEGLIGLINQGLTGKMVDISNDIRGRISYNHFILEKGYSKKEPIGFNYKIGMNTSTYLREQKTTIISKVMSIDEVDFDYSSKYRRYFDYNKVQGSLLVRNRKKGDKFVPLGMQGSKKLKDFFIDEKIPREIRETIPIVEDDLSILWIIGYRIGELYKITNETKKVLMLEYKE